MTGLRSHQRHYYFDILRKIVPAQYLGPQQFGLSGSGQLFGTWIEPDGQGKESSLIQCPLREAQSVRKTRNVVRLLGVDNTHKLTITF